VIRTDHAEEQEEAEFCLKIYTVTRELGNLRDGAAASGPVPEIDERTSSLVSPCVSEKLARPWHV